MSRFPLLLLLPGLLLPASMLGAAGPGPPASADVLWLDRTEGAGIDFRHIRGSSVGKYLPETMGAGLAVLDYDGDGWMDVYFVQSGEVGQEAAPPNLLLRNLGDGRFEDVTEASGAAGGGYGQGAVAGDYDGDSSADLFLTNLGANILLRNQGDGTFREETATAGLGDGAWSTSATFFDADADGDLDLYVVNYLEFTAATHIDCRERREGIVYYCHPDVYPASADRFYRNLGGGRFEDATSEAGLVGEGGKGLGVVAADLNSDGLPDLYVANDSTPNFHYLNLGDGRFSEVGLLVGTAYNEEGRTEAGMGVDAGDVDGDGALDLVVTNLSLESNALYLAAGGDYRYASQTSGLSGPSLLMLGFGTDLFDADNDGDLDLFVANGDVNDVVEFFNDALTWRQPAQLFVNDGTGRFDALSPARLGALARPRVGRGAASLDYDNDGRLDLVVSHNGDRARLFQNRAPEGRWVKFLPADGPGTRVRVQSGHRELIEEARTGSSYASSGDPRLHFGLAGRRADRVEITSPRGRRLRWLDLPDGSVYSYPALD